MLKKTIMAIMAALFTTAALAADVTGAGATFPQPIYVKWAEGYNKTTGNAINYQGIGSGAGIKALDAKTVVFGATDIPLKPEDLDKKGQVQFPMIIGGIVPIINVKGVEHLTLNVDVIAKIYMEEIKNWNDKQIADLNPGIKLPDLPIVKVRRSDGSGTTWNFTKFLNDVNENWKKKYGFGATIEWEGSAIGAKGNDGVANNVTQTNGAIGYVEYAFAKNNGLIAADMIGTDGKKVSPSLKAFKSTWPMVATSYIVMYKEAEDKAASKAAIAFFKYALEHDAEAEALDYIPLSKEAKDSTKKALDSVK